MARDSSPERLVLCRSSVGWGAAAAAVVAIILLGVALGRFEEFIWVIAPLAAAAVTNVLILLSAVLVGQTRQLRPIWWTLVALFSVYLVAASLHWPWARDLGTVGWIGLLVSGFPSSLSLLALISVQSLLQTPLAKGLELVESIICLLILPYFQHFVLLPKLFRKRRVDGEHRGPALTDGTNPAFDD
jgi:hypothetical protein